MAYPDSVPNVVSDKGRKINKIRRASDYAKLLEQRVTGQVAPPYQQQNKNTFPIYEYASTWLNWQCGMISGLMQGAVFLPGNGDRPVKPIAQWPQQNSNLSLLSTITKQVISEKNRIILSNEKYDKGNGFVCDAVGCPLMMDGQLVAVVAVAMSPRPESQRNSITQLLQWGILWLENLLRQQSGTHLKHSDVIVKLLSTVVKHKAAHASIIEAINLLADYLKCERVSFGLRENLLICIVSISHMARIDERNQAVRLIEAAMEESLDQLTTLVYPEDSESNKQICRAHSELVKHQGKQSVCTVPVPGRSTYVGAITFERNIEQPFDGKTREFCEQFVKLLGPVIESKLAEEQSPFSKLRLSVQLWFRRLFGPGHLKMKVATAIAFVLLSLFSIVKTNHQVTAPAVLQGAVRQLIVAPQDGYVKQGLIRAGEIVKEGDLLATLEDKTLKLEQEQLESNKKKLQQEYQQALAKRDRSQLGISLAELDQVSAQLGLVNNKIERTYLKASFDGVVVSGDLSQSQGAPVTLGEVLFEIAPLDNYRVILEVDEHDIANLKSGASARLRMKALPYTVFTVDIDSTTSVAMGRDGKTFFRVEGVLVNPSEELRPGMQGVAKIDIGRRNILWVWTHSIVNKLRLWLWSVGLLS